MAIEKNSILLFKKKIILVSLKQSFSTRQSMILKDQNTRDHSAWTEITCIECVSLTGYLAHENNRGEARGRNRHKNNVRE